MACLFMKKKYICTRFKQNKIKYQTYVRNCRDSRAAV